MRRVNIKIPLIAVLAFIGVSVSAHAQSKFAGRYDLIAGYSSGSPAGLFGYGVSSAARNGRVSSTLYFPYHRTTWKGTGRVSRDGVFSYTDGVRGSAKIIGNRVGVGNFRNSEGRGFFAFRRK
jgi:hypothetical protein